MKGALIAFAAALAVLAGAIGYQQIETHSLSDRLTTTVSQSANARVKTVQQRCDLTQLLVGVLTKQDPVAVGPFQQSYAKCEKQLVLVTRIAKQAP